MGILEHIFASKRAEVARQKRRFAPSLMATLAESTPPTRSFKQALSAPLAPRIIAEVKRASPSKGVLRPDRIWIPEDLAMAYERGGAIALSVLTDVHFFWGHPDALLACRDATALPCLRKDFIVDVYQVDESRVLGADAILLIARGLSLEVMQACAARAYELKMDVLVEVHDDIELNAALQVPDAILGVNNRDLSTLQVDPLRASRMRQKIPSERLVVAESGFSKPEELAAMASQGFAGFLIGEHLAKQDNPEAELKRMRQ